MNAGELKRLLSDVPDQVEVVVRAAGVDFNDGGRRFCADAADVYRAKVIWGDENYGHQDVVLGRVIRLGHREARVEMQEVLVLDSERADR